jgi:general secretion pathway protein A
MSPDPNLLYMTAPHREALAGLLFTVLEHKGLAVLTGEAGTGKTTLLRRALRDLPAERIPSSIIFNPMLTRDELLEMAMLGFGIKDIPPTKPQRLRSLLRFLIECQDTNRVPLLAIDEAHVLTRELLEEVRLLSNFELSDRKLLQIVLLGQGELNALLDQEDLRQVKQRIAVRLAVRPLTHAEAEGYIRFRWAECGGNGAVPFTGPAVASIATWSQGIPRIINALCDNALMSAFGQGSPVVTAQHVGEAATDLHLQRPAVAPVPPAARPVPVAAAVASVPVPTATEVEEPEAPPVPVTEMPPVRLFSAYSKPPRRSILWRWVGRVGEAGS